MDLRVPRQANTQCPSTQIVMSGYSQGGQLVHNAAELLESNTAALNQVAAGESLPRLWLAHNHPHYLSTLPINRRRLTKSVFLKVVIFGDPNDGDPVGTIPSSKVLIICHDGDNICDGGVLILPDHLNYQMDAQTAAQFVASQV